MDDEERFLTVDSDFEAGEYSSEFTLFEKEGEYFTKSQEMIKQFYHEVENIVRYSGLELMSMDDVNLYGFDKADKLFLVLRK